ncbi:MAG: hypothetical protein ACC661_08075, partial [Verrucomicrobiales bacterium]
MNHPLLCPREAVLLAVLVFAQNANASGPNLVGNPGFELDGVQAGAGTADITSWQVDQAGVGDYSFLNVIGNFTGANG